VRKPYVLVKGESDY